MGARVGAMLLLSAALLVAPAPAQEANFDCANATAEQEMNRCAGLDYEAADRELNKVWSVAIGSMRGLDAGQPEGAAGAAEALLAAQRAWLTFRDHQSLAEGFEAHLGSLEPFIVSTCLGRVTRARTEELKALSRAY
ncbi:MAG: lysozyme inhibitor LprI family protein [Cucumibacter sp.]